MTSHICFAWITVIAQAASAPAAAPPPGADGTSLGDIVGLVGGILGILGVVVGVTVYLTRLHDRIESAKIEDELRHLRERYEETNAAYQLLKRGGAAASAIKAELDTSLLMIARTVRAAGSCVLVPAPSLIANDTPTEMVFLSVHGPGSRQLKGTRVPLSSVAGQVYNDRKTLITHPPLNGFAKRADKVTRTQSAEMLVVPLIFNDACIGVAEFLNKEGGQFNSDDQQIAERLIAESLTRKVAEFVKDPENLSFFGITPRKDPTEATIVFCDLTNSGRLFDDYDAANVVDMINDYFERVCDVALRHGATVDKFIGDGVMLMFNVQRARPTHKLDSVLAALEMQEEFENLKTKWINLNLVGTSAIFQRVGIAAGRVQKAEMGHPQHRHLTVMGNTVHRAHRLCNEATRDDNAIVVGEEIYHVTRDRVEARDVSHNGLKAFEVVGRK